jgi:hypothetical protein
MYTLQSINDEDEKFEIPNMGWHYTVNSPVSCKREGKAFLDAIGKEIEINGKIHRVVGGEFFMILSDISIGEQIGIVVAYDL